LKNRSDLVVNEVANLELDGGEMFDPVGRLNLWRLLGVPALPGLDVMMEIASSAFPQHFDTADRPNQVIFERLFWAFDHFNLFNGRAKLFAFDHAQEPAKGQFGILGNVEINTDRLWISRRAVCSTFSRDNLSKSKGRLISGGGTAEVGKR
jgi:hypothetical protein